jgi:hypothetical protein
MFIFPLRYYANCETVYFFYNNPVFTYRTVQTLPTAQRSAQCFAWMFMWGLMMASFLAETCCRFSVFYEQMMCCVCLFIPLKQF